MFGAVWGWVGGRRHKLVLATHSQSSQHYFLFIATNSKRSNVVPIPVNPLKPGVWERLVIPRGGAQRPPLQSQ